MYNHIFGESGIYFSVLNTSVNNGLKPSLFGETVYMKNEKKLIFDGVLLTATTLALKTAGVAFSSALTTAAGAEAMGLSSQITAVYAFAVTAAAAGVNLGSMRLTAESRGAGRFSEIRAGVRCALRYCLRTGLVTSILLFIITPFLALRLIGNYGAILPLRLLAAVIPCISVAGAFHGYFNGVGRVYKSAAVNVAEQTVRITVTLAGLYSLTGDGGALPSALIDGVGGVISLISSSFGAQSDRTALACLTVVIGSITAESFSCLLLAVLYLVDSKRYPSADKSNRGSSRVLTSKFMGITVPMAVSALLRSGLSSAEHLLLPIGLRAYGSDAALAQYGTVSGMAIPVILYPMALMNSFAQLNTVDIAARVSAGETRECLKKRIGNGILFAVIYGIGCAALFRTFAYRIGDGLFMGAGAGEYICALSGYVVLAYIDHIADSMLKGLDQQRFVMRVNIIDSAIGLGCTALLVPAMGINGYVLSLYLCEFINCAASLGRLIYLMGWLPQLGRGFAVTVSVAILSVKLLYVFGLGEIPTVPAIVIAATVYFVSVAFVLNIIKMKEAGKTAVCGVHISDKY